jgi:DHA2 family multidrug resistance protein-like MFS transporter
MPDPTTTTSAAAEPRGRPARAPAVLATLIVVAGVANLNLSVANIALPEIGREFDASQSAINAVAVGFSLGLAATVLYLGAVGDRYGRKQMLVLGMALSVPACLLAAHASSVEVLALARILGGVAAGMAYPTTLSLITALWSGPARTAAIALWSGIGGGISAIGPLAAGLSLEHFWWGSAFLLTLPLAVVALVMALRLVPAHVHEGTEPVDHLGGALSVLAVAGVVLGIHFVGAPGMGEQALAIGGAGVVFTAAFFVRQRVAVNPLFDLGVAGRRVFWVAAVAGIIVFGSLMAAMFVGQQYLQNVLGYSAFEAGLSILPAAAAMVLVSPLSARLVGRKGSRFVLLLGYGWCIAGFVAMLVLWTEDAAYWRVGLAYLLIGTGVGLAGTPASRSLTGAVPVRRAGMASGTADLQRDLGGAVFQSILGVLLAAGYTAAFASTIAALPTDQQSAISDDVVTQLQKSFSGATQVAEQFPQHAPQILEAARQSFLQGDEWAYSAGALAAVLGAVLVFFAFPRRADEQALLVRYVAQDDPDGDSSDGTGADREAPTGPAPTDGVKGAAAGVAGLSPGR